MLAMVFPGKDALEDTAHNGGFLVNYPFAFFLFGSAVAIADTTRTAQAFFHSGLENSFDFAAGVGNVPLVYHVTENRHNITPQKIPISALNYKISLMSNLILIVRMQSGVRILPTSGQ